MKNIPVISWFDDATVKHMRFGFSFFLLPVYLFALSQAQSVNIWNAILIFFILHFLVFPASNGYNSYEDKDESSIGGLRKPPRVNKNLYKLTAAFDLLAVLLSFLLSLQVALLVFVFIIMSRSYSYRGLRIKKYPFPAFIIVFLFQGAHVYLVSEMAVNGTGIAEALNGDTIICMAISSLFIGSMYPLTQIYQHESDKKDGVISISYKLGYKGTFIFSATLFTLATLMLIYYFIENHFLVPILLFVLLLSPVIIRMGIWFNRVKKNVKNADFDNTMMMNKLTSASMNLYFLLLIIL